MRKIILSALALFIFGFAGAQKKMEIKFPQKEHIRSTLTQLTTHQATDLKKRPKTALKTLSLLIFIYSILQTVLSQAQLFPFTRKII